MVRSSTTIEAEVYCILGMHRSGTSVAARALNLLGLYLGSEESIGETGDDNVKGYWEHRGIRELNEQILARLGGSWHEPPTFAPGWENTPAITELLEPARALLDQEFAGIEKWGWKDPRNCLTLPFWQRILPNIRYVITVRNPIEIAHSLEHRNGFCIEKSINLWLSYTNHALQHTSGRRRLFLSYENFVIDWRSELQRAADFIREPGRAGLAEVQTAVQQFIERGLHHHRSSLADAVTDSRFAFPAKAFYVAQRMYTTMSKKDVTGHDNLVTEPEECLNLISQHSVEAQDELASLRDQVTRNRESLEEYENRVTVLREQLRKQGGLLAEHQNSIKGLREELTRQENLLSQREKTIEVLKRRIDRITNTIGWRLLSYYGPIKYRYLLPIYRLLGASPSYAKEDVKVNDDNQPKTTLEP